MCNKINSSQKEIEEKDNNTQKSKTLFYKNNNYTILIGKFLLIDFMKNNKPINEITECKVIDFSPSCLYVKLEINESSNWFETTKINVKEVLSEEASSELNRRIYNGMLSYTTLKGMIEFTPKFSTGRYFGKSIEDFSSENEIEYLRWYSRSYPLDRTKYLHLSIIKKLEDIDK